MGTMTPGIRAAATLAFVREHLGLAPDARAVMPDAATLDALRALRDEVREDLHGGGCCSVVCEELETGRGWRRCGVAYLSEGGEVVCEAHFVSVLADGTIVDATADQFGEGDEIRVVRPGDALYGRYRPEFYQDFHPGISPGAAAWAGDWTGELDMDAAIRLEAERGPAWWVGEPDAILAYMERNARYEAACPGHDGRAVRKIEADMDAVRARFASPSP